jgi:hypothetical protein
VAWRLDHVQLAIPPGGERQCDEFYVNVLVFTFSKSLARSLRVVGAGIGATTPRCTLALKKISVPQKSARCSRR